MVGLEKAISWQRYKRSTIMKVPGKSANEPTWFQLLSHVCSFYGVGTVEAGKKVVDNRGLTLKVVYNHWTGTVDWNGGMEWWNRKFSKNEAKWSYFLMHEDVNSDLMASLAYTEVKCLS